MGLFRVAEAPVHEAQGTGRDQHDCHDPYEVQFLVPCGSVIVPMVIAPAFAIAVAIAIAFAFAVSVP